jgi:hypothetical protein
VPRALLRWACLWLASASLVFAPLAIAWRTEHSSLALVSAPWLLWASWPVAQARARADVCLAGVLALPLMALGLALDWARSEQIWPALALALGLSVSAAAYAWQSSTNAIRSSFLGVWWGIVVGLPLLAHLPVLLGAPLYGSGHELLQGLAQLSWVELIVQAAPRGASALPPSLPWLAAILPLGCCAWAARREARTLDA